MNDERILVFGEPGCGKSYAWLSIARFLQETGQPGICYCIDTDRSIHRMLANEFSDLRNVVVMEAYDWDEYRVALDTFLRQIKPEDWIIMDMIDMAWDAAQRHFVERVFDRGIDDYFLHMRSVLEQRNDSKSKREAPKFDGWRDWQVINKIYDGVVLKMIYRTRCNIFCTAKLEKVSDEDGQDIRQMFGPWRVKPKGQKSLGYQFHTVLWMSRSGVGEYRITTIKDRGRDGFDGEPLVNFPLQYLVGKGGCTVNSAATP